MGPGEIGCVQIFSKTLRGQGQTCPPDEPSQAGTATIHPSPQLEAVHLRHPSPATLLMTQMS